MKGSVAKNKKRLYLIFQLAVFKHLLNSLFVKNNFLQQSPKKGLSHNGIFENYGC